MAVVDIIPANLRDCTYVGANLRSHDRREILCQLDPGVSGSHALAFIHQITPAEWLWVAAYRNQPAAVFGFQRATAAVWVAMCMGTSKLRKCVPAITAHMTGLEPRLIAAGCRRIEVRAIKGHDIARLWLKRLGCQHVCDLPESGREGEEFELWARFRSEGH
jgi:hypothetical protein